MNSYIMKEYKASTPLSTPMSRRRTLPVNQEAPSMRLPQFPAIPKSYCIIITYSIHTPIERIYIFFILDNI